MDKLRSFTRHLTVRLANGIANFLPDDALSKRIRPAIYRIIGCQFGHGTVMCGGTYINGFNISVGSNSFLNRSLYFDLNAPVVIGDNVHIGNHVRFITTQHEIGPAHRRCGDAVAKDILVGNGAWIGAGAMLLPGVHVAAGAVIAAGAVVTKNVPNDSLFAGIPARFLRQLDH